MSTKGNDPAPQEQPEQDQRPTTMPGRNGGTLKRGQTINKKGRGKGRLNNKTILKKWLSTQVETINPVTKQPEMMSALEAMTVMLIGNAIKGDVKAYKELIDRMDGKARQSVEIDTPDGKPLQMELRHDLDYSALDTETLRKISAARRRPSDG